MAAPQEILEEFCSGRATLDATRRALEHAGSPGPDHQHGVSAAIAQFLHEGRLSSEDATRLTAEAAPAPPDNLTLLRPSGSTDPVLSRPAATGSAPGAVSGSSSGWRQWAAEDKVPAATVGVGTVLRERFVIEEIVGEGGMGLVFRARDRRREEANDRNPYVAIKVLGDDFKTHPDSLIALQREARRMQQLSHPNIASVYDFDRDATHVFLVMELLEGESLDRLLARSAGAGLPLEQAREIIEGVGSALRHAHTRGLVHSDFKPANVFVTRGGEVKVIDFGIARIAKDATHVGDAVYTVFDAGKLGAYTNSYASPEQMLEGSVPDPKDDIYALGLVAYEVLSGRHPFGRKSAIDAKFRGMTVEPLAVLNEHQNAVLASALEFDRDKRLGDILELVRTLAPHGDDAIRATERIGAGRVEQAQELAAPRRKNWRLIGFAVVGLAWVGFFWAYWSSRDDAASPGSGPSASAGAAAPTVEPPASVSASMVGGAETDDKPARRDVEAKATVRTAPAAVEPRAVAKIDPAADAQGTTPVLPETAEAKADPAAAGGTIEPSTADAEASPGPEPAGETGKRALYRWVDSNGTVQFGEKPPEEYAASAVKVIDL